MEKVKSSEKIISRMKELGKLLNEASRAYYQESRELMPNLEYDRLYDELASLERESGIVLSGSPTTTVGYEVLSALPKEAHPEKMHEYPFETPVRRLDEVGAARKPVVRYIYNPE